MVRQVPVVWPEDVFQTSRVQVTTTLCNDLWISGGVQCTESLRVFNIQMQSSTLSNSCVPRLRQPCSSVDVVLLLEIGIFRLAILRHLRYQRGTASKTSKQIAQERWGHAPQPTCKGVARKDFMYISPELRDFLVEVKLEHDVWSDHSVLAGIFIGGPAHIKSFHWRMPRSFPWPNDFRQFSFGASRFSPKSTLAYWHSWCVVFNKVQKTFQQFNIVDQNIHTLFDLGLLLPVGLGWVGKSKNSATQNSLENMDWNLRILKHFRKIEELELEHVPNSKKKHIRSPKCQNVKVPKIQVFHKKRSIQGGPALLINGVMIPMNLGL